MKIALRIIQWILIIIGAFAVYYLLLFQFKHDGLSLKIINEIISPKLHEDAIGKVYIPMANRLLETGDIAMASIIRVRVDEDVSNAEVEEAMASVATDEGIREVGILPLSEQVELQTDEPQRFLKIFQYCSPRTAMEMIDFSDAFSAYLPCRIALVEHKDKSRWLYTLDMNMMIYGGKPIPPGLYEKAKEVQRIITEIQNRGAEGDF